MGMAASQARFLSLTARKSNVEYQGQQVNQERTALANESANLYTQLNNLEVPTPPIVEDFKKTEYSFTSSKVNGENKTFRLNEIVSRPDGDYAVLFTDETYYTSSLVNLGKNGGTISGRGELTNEEEAMYSKYFEDIDDNFTGKKISTILGEFPIFSGSAADYANELCYIADPNEGGNTNFRDTYLTKNEKTGKYEVITGDEAPMVYFYIDNDGKRCFLDPSDMNDDTPKNTSTALYVTSGTTTTQKEYKVTYYNKNDLGRLTSISIETDRKNGEEPIIETFELNVATVQDEDAYNQAMLDYEYKKSAYEKATSDINAKTATIQSEDKTLELHLKQLDTEQSAIKTEMDAVKKVADDNVEATFKTFG